MMQLNNFVTLTCFIVGLASAFLGHKKGHNPISWFFAGFFLGGLGIVLMLYFFSKKKKKAPQQMPSPLPKNAVFWSNMWYYLDLNHTQQGPYEFPDLMEIWNKKELSENSYIWTEGMPNWRVVSELPGLIEEFTSPNR